MIASYPPAAENPYNPESDASWRDWIAANARVLNNVQAGKLNAVGEVTLAAGAASTVIIDPRISVQSYIGLMPTTANAAAEIGNATLYVSARNTGTATLAHANNAQTDRAFTYVVIA